MAVLGVGNDPDSEVAKEYAVLKSTFDAQRRLLSEDGPLLEYNDPIAEFLPAIDGG